MENFSDVVNFFIDMIKLLVPLVFGLTFLVIAWKVIDAWIINGADGEKREEGKNVVFVGVIALVVMSGIWGILSMLQSSLLP